MLGVTDGSGLFAVAGHPSAARLTTVGLQALQHRGTLGASLTVGHEGALHQEWGRGEVEAALPEHRVMAMVGQRAIGQVWGQALDDAQHHADSLRMVSGHVSAGPFAAAMAGRFTNGDELRQRLMSEGAFLQTLSDAELLLNLVGRSSQRTAVNRVVDAIWQLRGGFSVVLATSNALVALRDPAGHRPLFLGAFGSATLLATEDAAILAAGGVVLREVAPGEMLVITGHQVQSVRPFATQAPQACIQEPLALSPVSSQLRGLSLGELRVAWGEQLAAIHPAPEADCVVSLPGQREGAAQGFAQATGLTVVEALKVAGADLWRPAPALGVSWGATAALVQGRQVALVVGGSRSSASLKGAISALRGAGAVAVHLRAVGPQARGRCPFGVHVPEEDPMVSAEWLGAASFATLPAQALHAVLGGGGWCERCLTPDSQAGPHAESDQLPLF